LFAGAHTPSVAVGLADRFRSQLGEDRLQSADAFGERISIITGDVVEFLGENRGLIVRQVKVHDRLCEPYRAAIQTVYHADKKGERPRKRSRNLRC
jgi:hypothetical protein